MYRKRTRIKAVRVASLRNRLIVMGRMSGLTLHELADKFSVSTQRVSQIVRLAQVPRKKPGRPKREQTPLRAYMADARKVASLPRQSRELGTGRIPDTSAVCLQ